MDKGKDLNHFAQALPGVRQSQPDWHRTSECAIIKHANNI